MQSLTLVSPWIISSHQNMWTLFLLLVYWKFSVFYFPESQGKSFIVFHFHVVIHSNSCHRAYLLAMIVEKSKKCVDFTFTLIFIHFVVTTFRYQVSSSSLRNDWLQ
jgi:hypothetical protein